MGLTSCSQVRMAEMPLPSAIYSNIGLQSRVWDPHRISI
jgi:hypothetical protein